jgi:hypothetical protein
MVETRGDWLAEAVWAGEFCAGDFDKTDLVFGTGIRCRGDNVTFVSSGSTLDRLWHCRHNGRQYVSNSLPALLAVAGLSLRDDYDYATPMKTICGGLSAYRRVFATDSSSIHVVYFSNLSYDGEGLVEVRKPDESPDFTSYRDYTSFLLGCAKGLKENLCSPERQTPVATLTSVSSGYDSPAASVIARHAGCKDAVTFLKAASLWRGADSGQTIGHQLGLRVGALDATAAGYPLEETIWSVVGRPGVLNWTLFDYPEPLCCFFTGCHGDKVWARVGPELADVFEIPSVADLGIGEFRLFKGVFHCPVPFWGIRKLGQIRAISALPEMKAWTLGTAYDRPIPRRIAEEAGVSRELFGIRKKNTSSEAFFLWPYSPDAKASFARYVRGRGQYAPSRPTLAFLRFFTHWDSLMHKNITRRLGIRKSLRHFLTLKGSTLLFQWANSVLKERYAKGLGGSGRQEKCVATRGIGTAHAEGT